METAFPGSWNLLGGIYVGENEIEFTAEDEETLVMFASQAALVIANARRHREEQRARADLETLVNTTPVGVLVLDAGTGEVRSINREARRIVIGLCEPGDSAEQLLEVLTFRRADGRGFPGREHPGALRWNTPTALGTTAGAGCRSTTSWTNGAAPLG